MARTRKGKGGRHAARQISTQPGRTSVNGRRAIRGIKQRYGERICRLRSVKELVALAKSKPGGLRYASGGNGSGPHLATELLKVLAQIDLTHVPYKGTGPALIDLLSGQVDMMIAVTAAALPHVKAGKLHALDVTGAERTAVAPGIPTVAEAGVPDYEFKTWYGIQVAARTPRAIVNRINSDVSRVLKLVEVVDSFVGAGLEPRASTPEEFASLVRSEIEKWAKVIKASGATIE